MVGVGAHFLSQHQSVPRGLLCYGGYPQPSLGRGAWIDHHNHLTSDVISLMCSFRKGNDNKMAFFVPPF